MDYFDPPPLVLNDPPGSVEELEKLQQQRFQNLLKFTLEHSKFYREHLGEYGLSTDKPDEITVKDIPPVTKNLLMDHYNDVVCDKNLVKRELEEFISNPEFFGQKYRGKYRVCQTSGSTGQPGIFAYGPGELELLRSILIKRNLRGGPPGNMKIRIAGFLQVNGHYSGVSKLLTMPADRFDIRLYSINAPLADTIQSLNAFRPQGLVGYSSSLDILACEQLKGNLTIYPMQITCGGDHLTPEINENLQKAFGKSPKNTYSCTESLVMSASCLEHKIHLFTDWNILEILDENLNPVSPGKEGKLYLTSLYNYTQPLIRYDMNDRLVLAGERCACGSVFPVLEKISGRQEEFLWFKKKDGSDRFIHPNVTSGLFVPGLKKYQVVQGENSDLTLKVVLDKPEQAAAVEKRMQKILEENELDDTVTFRVRVVEEIKSDEKIGKFRRTVPFKK